MPPTPSRGVELLRWFARDRCLGRDLETGETFTVRGGIPGERVEVRTTPRPSGIERGVETVLLASPSRITPSCPNAAICPGCSLLHLSGRDEDALVRLTLSEVLLRHAGVDWPAERIGLVVPTRRGGHRRRAWFELGRDGGRLIAGLRAHEGGVVDARECEANHPDVTRVARQVVEGLDEPGLDSRFEGFSVISGEGVAVVLQARDAAEALGDDATARVVDALLGAGVCAVALSQGREPARLIAGAWPASAPVAGLSVGSVGAGWVQPNPEAATGLYAWVEQVAAAEGLDVLDATCGTGVLSVVVGRTARGLLGVDANWPSVQGAQELARALGLPHLRFAGGRIETVAPRLHARGERFDVTIVNPMRKSLGDETMVALAAMTRQRFIYLAPAPRAGAEDVARVLREGFELREVVAANYHPGTGHAVMATLLERTG
jgi:23S rRNA (uracil1939-C5)-methyltransferase